MAHLLIDNIRISGFRGLKEFSMTLEQTTVLTGMNNSGKTSILKAIQLALGNRSFLSIEDLYTSNSYSADKIIIDIRITQIDDNGNLLEDFDDNWEAIFTTEKIKIDTEKNVSYIPLRTVATYDNLNSKFIIEYHILNTWEPNVGAKWQDIIGKKQSFNIEEMPFFYVEAQRDIVEDMKQRSSYLGKMLAGVVKDYSKEDLDALESLIDDVNKEAINKSSILTTITTALEGVNSAMDKQNNSVEISPFAKKIRDLSKGISINYGELNDNYSMDYHGMGTRSWSSLLILKAFIMHGEKLAKEKDKVFFPIIAIEEPESHLHPNAQKKLYRQIKEMPGQKIISTHSPYIAASTNLSEVRGIHKEDTTVVSGLIDISKIDPNEQRKLRQKVINMRGEIFFSKALVLFEGETEEQALPIFAEKYFGCPPSELGIDFIGVGGAGQYYPFLVFAEAMNIPWYIFSDGEKKPVEMMTKAVRKIKGDAFTEIENERAVIILNGEEDFEWHLINQGYIREIEKTLKELYGTDCITKKLKGTPKPQREKTEKICDKCSQNIYEDIVRNYKGDAGYNLALYDLMTSQKASFSPVVAHKICDSKKIPEKVNALFTIINKKLYHEHS